MIAAECEASMSVLRRIHCIARFTCSHSFA
jgi:hypothetical protein